MVRPTVEDFQFRTLSVMDEGSLVKPFSVEEVKAAVWDNEVNFGFNFGFLKEFWSEMQGDIM
ncbi:cysteine-rich receptor-like protein kinase, partial [Trifolium medium]|nr:cysteine-rich receptor-like protein kinase [Trifolium medium]